MLPVLIMLAPGLRNDFIACPKFTLQHMVLPIMDVKTWWNSRLELLQ
jgi:hypothetical protein